MRNRNKSKYEKYYLPADKYFCVNYDDEDLRPIYISLPSPPKLELIDGYGLHPLEQKFKRLEIPHRLKLLEKRVYKELQEWSEKRQSNIITGYRIYQKYWEILINEQKDFEEEIKFIKNVIWYTIHGYWCFIKGKPTYLSPWYFFFLNHWYMPYLETIEKYPEYRHDDKNTELFKWYLFNTHETFKNLDDYGNAIKNKNGIYEMIDMDNRTFEGSMMPKRRRRGESSRSLNNGSCIARTGLSKSCTIVADKGENAVKHYEKRVLPAWQSWPLFLKPLWDGDNSPSRLAFKSPSNIYNEKSLGSIYYITTSAGERANDSDRLDFLLSDESGKLERVSATTRWGVNRLTLKQGAQIHGWSEHPSTIEEMNEGGEEYYSMFKHSDFYNRDKITGQTKSGLAREFVPAFRAYDGFIDPWGFSVIDIPTQEQLDYSYDNCSYKQKKIGAKEYHITRRERLLKSGSPIDLKEYREIRRREPIKSSECWMGIGGDVGFPIEFMTKRLSKLRIDNYNKIITGNFIWRGGIRDSISDFIENPNGKFNVSLLLDRKIDERIPYRSNEVKLIRKRSIKYQRYIDVFSPINKSRFTVGIDPFENLLKEAGGYSQTRLSDGGIAVYWEIDNILEPEWDSNIGNSGRFVCTYRNRPNNFHDFVEDVILVSRYYGAMMYFERNKNELINRIDDRGYSGYFKYRYNITKNMFDATPGGYAGLDSIDSLFNSLRDYFDLRSHIEIHHDLLQEGIGITGREKLKRNDLLAAAGWALEGSKSTYGMLLDKAENSYNNYIDLHGTFLQPRVY
jgi:hypothetical protein